MEQWKKIEGYSNYSVSDIGRIRNDRNGRILKPRVSTSGYYQVMMGRKTIPQYVHRLVAKAFITNEFNKPQVDHKDGNKLNNKVENLRWVTASENRYGYGYDECNLHKQKPVIAKYKTGDILEFASRKQAAEYFCCSTTKIRYGKEFTKGRKEGWTFELKK